MLYRKKPLVIEALQFKSPENFESGKSKIWDFPIQLAPFSKRFFTYIVTSNGTIVVDEGDWIIKGIKGEFYPCKDDIFKLTYDEVK